MENSSTRTSIEKLLAVQKLDAQIARCKNELGFMPQRKEAIAAAAADSSGAAEKAKSLLQNAKAGVHALELEIEAGHQNIAKLRTQQLQIKTNQEYKALNKEIALAEEKIKSLEDRLIDLMEDVEQAEANLITVKAELEEQKARGQKELDIMEKKRGAMDDEVKRLQDKRSELSADIDKAWLGRYNMVMENKKDIALAGVDQSGTCEACHMNLPPQVIHDVRKEATMISCSFCGRLLYRAD